MYKNFSLVIIFLFIFCKYLLATELYVGVNISKGHFEFSESFREVHSNIYLNNYFPLETLDNFPDYYIYQAHFGLKEFLRYNPGFGLGAYIDVSSTGGYTYYRDYTGLFILDQTVKRTSIGIQIEQLILRYKIFHFHITNQISYIKTEMNEIYRYIISNSGVDNINNYTSNGWGIEPGIAIEMRFWSITFKIIGSYQINQSSKLKMKSNTSEEIYYPYNIDWSGFRYGISFGYILNLNTIFE